MAALWFFGVTNWFAVDDQLFMGRVCAISSTGVLLSAAVRENYLAV